MIIRRINYDFTYQCDCDIHVVVALMTKFNLSDTAMLDKIIELVENDWFYFQKYIMGWEDERMLRIVEFQTDNIKQLDKDGYSFLFHVNIEPFY